MHTDISDWVHACRDGDELAFRKIYDHLHQELFAFLATRARTRDLWQALARFRYSSDKQFYAFVYKIARRKLARHYQRHQSLQEIEPHHASTTFTFNDLSGVQKLLTTLPEKLRLVVELRYVVDLPFSEIAIRLGEKETTVKVRHHRALKKLAHVIQTYD